MSTYEYLSLQNRFKRLERQYGELQDLATAYSEVIRGFSPTEQVTVSIDQLQAEAGRNGLRTKALEADMLRPLIREAGGLQALISQTHTVRALIEKAGGLQELEQFVSDLRTIRDTLDEMTGSQGLGSLASEVRHLLTIKQEHAELGSQVNDASNLKAKAARYERLMQAFTDVQTDIPYHQHNAITSNSSSTHAKRGIQSAIAPTGGPPTEGGSIAVPSTMNPARARLISTTSLEADPDRDLYEATPPVTKPLNKTGSNSTPLGTSQAQSVVQLANQATPFSTLKRKRSNYITSSGPKLPRVDIGRFSAPVQTSLASATVDSTERVLARFHKINTENGDKGFPPRTQKDRDDAKIDRFKDAITLPHARASEDPLRRADRMHTDVQFGDARFKSTSGGQMPTCFPVYPSHVSEPYTDLRSAPARFTAVASSRPTPFSRKTSGDMSTGQTAV